MTNITPISIQPILLKSQQKADFEQIIAEKSQQIATETTVNGEIMYNDADIADMIIANGVITESIRQMREHEQKLKEILDEA